MDLEKVIKDTVTLTVDHLRTEGLLKDLRDQDKTAYEKTEDLLRNYNALSMSDDRTAHELVSRIEKALTFIQKDPYYEIITLYYIGGRTREQLASKYNTSVTTISRNKARLIRQLQVILFSSDYIRQHLS